ncbi:MAG: phytoene desaturase, partial [Bacteroidia bacterium]|nr:phytoene desaturase [Bacteroidia bacterium]
MNKNKSGDTCIIVGAGIAGLAASIRMSMSGRKVIILESNAFVGGKISEKRIGDFRFDIGPSLLTKPEYISELFTLCGKNSEHYLQFEKLDNLFRFFFTDGTSIDLFSDRAKLQEELLDKTEEPFENITEVLKASELIYELTHEVFLERSLHKIRNYFNKATLKGLLRFYKVRTFETMHHYNSRKLSDQRLVQIFDRYASYNGSNPFKAPATLNVINHFELNEGAYFPVGGMQAIVSALHKLADDCGVQIQTNTRVDEILVQNGKVSGVRIADKVLESSCVICNVDISTAYNKLLPSVSKPQFVLKQEGSSSAVVFLWGLKKVFAEVGLHNTFFGNDDKSEYDSIFEKQEVSDDPSFYLYNSSLKNPSDAPPGMSNWFVMVTAPSDSGQDWKLIVQKVRLHVLRKIQELLGENIEEYIGVEEVLTPLHFAKHTGSWNGSIYGSSSNGILSAFLRHPNF